MSIKNELRKKYKQARKNISEKRSKDKLINEFLCNMECYKSCDMVLFYAALDDEVNLDLSIKASLDYGKKVALPVCIDNNGKMQYYYIRSLDDVKIGAFGVREPDVNFCTLVDDYTDAIVLFLRLHLINRVIALATARDTMTDFYVILTEYQSVFPMMNV